MSQAKIEASQIELVAMPNQIGSYWNGWPSPRYPYPWTNYGIAGWAKAADIVMGNQEAVSWDARLTNYLNTSFESKGLFFVPWPTEQDGGLSVASMDNLNYKSVNSGLENGRTRLTDEIKKSQSEVISSWNAVMADPRSVKNESYDQGKVWFLGPISNSSVIASGGNNIVFASPAMYQSQWSQLESERVGFLSDGNDRQHTKTVFFPSSQGTYQTNTINLGGGNDLVYYDSSFKLIRGGDGENIFLPSFGSFNWAFQYPVRTDGYKRFVSFDDQIQQHKSTFGDSTVFLLNPIQKPRYDTQDIYTAAINTYDQAGSSPSVPPGVVQGKQVFFADKPSGENNKLNHIGGQTIVGGGDGDIFYGIDPAFYDGVPLQELVADSATGKAEMVVNRYAFLNPASDTKNARFNIQNYETVNMFGGEGSDIFYFGNPGNINPSAINRTGAAAYLVAGSHSKASSDADRKNKLWADHDNAPNTYVFNLTTSAKSYTNQSSSFDPKAGESTGLVDVAKAEWELFKKTANVFMAIGENVPYVKAVTAGIEFGQAVYQLGSVFSKLVNPDPAPISTSTESLEIPVTNWKNQVIINDWAPSDSIRISVDTSYTGKEYKNAFAARWKASKLEIQSQQSSESSAAAKVVWQVGRDTTDIIQLQGFNHSDATATFGYRSYNFETAKYEWLTARHLDFFGHISIGNETNGISPLKNYTANNGFVFSSTQPGVVSASPNGSYVFYWNDSIGLGDRGLDEARQHSSAITIDFDSRKLGWYWQPSYKQPSVIDSNNPASAFDTLELDHANSRLWINEGPGWKFYTFDQIENDVTAMVAALRSSTFYAVTDSGTLKPEAKQVANEKLIGDLSLLGDYMPSLTDLQQNWGNDAPKIENLYEITHVKKSGDGVIVYFTKESVAYQTLVRDVGGQAVAEPPSRLLKSALRQLEASSSVDVDADGVIADLDEVLAYSGHAGTYAFNVYNDILDRDPTTAELEAAVQMVGAIESPVNTLNKIPQVRELIEQLVLSDEFLAQHAEGDGKFVEMLYEELLGQVAPDQAHVQHFVELLEAGLRPEDIAWLFLESDALDVAHGTPEGSVEIVGVIPDPSV